jgi:hypothetical protein
LIVALLHLVAVVDHPSDMSGKVEMAYMTFAFIIGCGLVFVSLFVPRIAAAPNSGLTEAD